MLRFPRPFSAANLSLLPYPGGRAFAFTIIDDTDGATLENVQPIYDCLDDLGFRTTKTVWVSRPQDLSRRPCDDGDTLERLEYAAWARRLAGRGFEIALHNVSSGHNERGAIARGIERFRQILGNYPAINVHHEKARENLYFDFAVSGAHLPPPFRSAGLRRLHRALRRPSRVAPRRCSGEVPSSPYFWGDLCQATIRYVRTNLFFRELNTLKCSPEMPLSCDRTPYVRRWFDSSNGQDVATFNAILADRNIDRLRAEHGAAILYTHFGLGFASEGPRGPELNAETRGRLAAVALHADAWRPTVSELLDRLELFKNVTVRDISPGIALHNANCGPIDALTFQTTPNAEFCDLSGVAYRAGPDGRFVVPCLAAGATLVLLPAARGAPARWFEPRGPSWLLDIRTALRKIAQ